MKNNDEATMMADLDDRELRAVDGGLCWYYVLQAVDAMLWTNFSGSEVGQALEQFCQ